MSNLKKRLSEISELRHSDNICTASRTNIWGRLTPEDMEFLLDVCPKGKFTPTFYAPKIKVNSPETLREYLRGSMYSSGPQGFYFDFPLDQRGEHLIKAING